MFASDWLESLIHIHSIRGVAHFKLFVDERRRAVSLTANFNPEGRCLMLEEPDTWKEVLILYQSKVSIAVGKHCNVFFDHTSIILLPKRVNKSIHLFEISPKSLRASPHVETGQQSGILNYVFRLQYFKSGQFEWYWGKRFAIVN